MKTGKRPTRYSWFAMTPSKFLLDASYETMTAEVVGAHFLLLLRAWVSDPVGSLPADDETLARIARVSSERWAAIKGEVLTDWIRRRNRVHSVFLTSEFSRCEEEYKAKVKGNEKRWGNAREINDFQTSRHRDDDVTMTSREQKERNGIDGTEEKREEQTRRATEVASVRGEEPATGDQSGLESASSVSSFFSPSRPSSSVRCNEGFGKADPLIVAPVQEWLRRAMRRKAQTDAFGVPDEKIVLQVIEASGHAPLDEISTELQVLSDQGGPPVTSWGWWPAAVKQVFTSRKQGAKKKGYEPQGAIF